MDPIIYKAVANQSSMTASTGGGFGALGIVVGMVCKEIF